MAKLKHINGVRKGDTVHFFIVGETRAITGQVFNLKFGATQCDYAEVYVSVDGMTYIFGTGGHLGNTWTTESGSEQWFLEVK